SKSNLLYHLDRAKEGIRRQDFAILVEGYMDAIAVARVGISNVVASCGTSLAEQQIKLLSRFTKRVVVNYDPDAAGQSATERSLSLLLEQDFEVRVLVLPPVGDKKADPDLYIREKGAEEYQKRLKNARLYHGLETEKIFAALVVASLSGQPAQATGVAAILAERDRRLLFEILFEEASEPTWEEALSCIETLQQRQAEQELAEVQRSI